MVISFSILDACGSPEYVSVEILFTERLTHFVCCCGLITCYNVLFFSFDWPFYRRVFLYILYILLGLESVNSINKKIEKNCREYLQATLKMSLVHCKNVEKSNKVTCTHFFLQIQNGLSDAVIINSTLHRVKIDNPSSIIIGEINMKPNQEKIGTIKICS